MASEAPLTTAVPPAFGILGDEEVVGAGMTVASDVTVGATRAAELSSVLWLVGVRAGSDASSREDASAGGTAMSTCIRSLLSEYTKRRSPYRCISSMGIASRKSFNSRNCSSSWFNSEGGRPPTLAYLELV